MTREEMRDMPLLHQIENAESLEILRELVGEILPNRYAAKAEFITECGSHIVVLYRAAAKRELELQTK